jgi:hypothetical protein
MRDAALSKSASIHKAYVHKVLPFLAVLEELHAKQGRCASLKEMKIFSTTYSLGEQRRMYGLHVGYDISTRWNTTDHGEADVGRLGLPLSALLRASARFTTVTRAEA